MAGVWIWVGLQIVWEFPRGRSWLSMLHLARNYIYRKGCNGLTKVGNTRRSKHATHPTNNAAHPSATSARTAVPCCGYGIITIPSWFIRLRPRLIRIYRFPRRWFVLWAARSRSGYGGRRERRVRMRRLEGIVWRDGIRRMDCFTNRSTMHRKFEEILNIHSWLSRRICFDDLSDVTLAGFIQRWRYKIVRAAKFSSPRWILFVSSMMFRKNTAIKEFIRWREGGRSVSKYLHSVIKVINPLLQWDRSYSRTNQYQVVKHEWFETTKMLSTKSGFDS